MTNIIVAFPRPGDGGNIRNILTRNGFSVAAVASSGAQAISSADELGSGILICGSRFPDMVYQDIFECLPAGFQMLLVASAEKQRGLIPAGIMSLGLPLKVHDLLDTLEMMDQAQARRRKKAGKGGSRSEEEQDLIRRAKELLMDRNHMSEPEAHRYIQKCSMDSGTNMVETSQMIMSLIV